MPDKEKEEKKKELMKEQQKPSSAKQPPISTKSAVPPPHKSDEEAADVTESSKADKPHSKEQTESILPPWMDPPKQESAMSVDALYRIYSIMEDFVYGRAGDKEELRRLHAKAVIQFLERELDKKGYHIERGLLVPHGHYVDPHETDASKVIKPRKQ